MVVLGTSLVVLTGGGDAATTMVGYGSHALDGQWWRFIVGAAVLPDPRLYLVMVPLLVLAVGNYEHRVGWRTTAGVLAATHLAGTVGAAVLVRALSDTGWPWMTFTADQTDLGLSAGVVGVVAALTATLPVGPRRTLRWVGTGFLAVMLLRSGLLWDAEHLLGWAAGLCLGGVARRRSICSAAMRRSGQRPSGMPTRSVAALGVLVLAGSELVLALYPGVGGLFAVHPQAGAGAGRIGTTVLLAAAAVLIADALRRGLPAGWWAGATLTCLMGARSALTDGSDAAAGVGALLWIGLLGALVSCRHHWPSRLPMRTLRRIGSRLLLAMLGFIAASTVTVWLLRDALSASDPRRTLHQILLRAMFAGGDLEPQTTWAAVILVVSSWVWALVLLVLLARLLHVALPGLPRHSRPAGVASRHSVGAAEPRVPTARTGVDAQPAAGDGGQRMFWWRQMLRYGGGNLGWQRTWPRVSTWHGSGPAADVSIGYRLEQSVAIVIGDPVGPKAHWKAAAEQFTSLAQQQGWTVAWYAVSHAFVTSVGPSRTLQIGEDAVIELAGLRFTGKAWQDVRTARNKAGKENITLREVDLATADPELRAQIDGVSGAWSDGKALPEMGFSLGTIELADDGQMRTIVAVDAAGTVHGVTTWMPIHESGRVVGWTLDVMRRRPDGFRPVMEFLIAECLLLFQTEGCVRASLSVAPLARNDSGAADAGTLARGLDKIAELLEPVYGFRSLLAYKRKFGPRFEPVYLAYGSAWELSEIGLAICHAYLPDLTAAQALSIGQALRQGRRRKRTAPSPSASANRHSRSAAAAA